MTDNHASEEEEVSRTSTSLLRRARQGQEEGWDQLIKKYGLRVYQWCQKAGLQKADAADVSQEVFTAVARKLDRFRRDRDGDSFRKWIRRITTNKIRDYWRQQKPGDEGRGGSTWQQKLSELVGESWEDSSSSIMREGNTEEFQREVIERVRSEVTSRDWAILERVILDAQSPSDVALEFDTSVNAVYIVKSRMLRRLRKAMLRNHGE